MTETARRVAIFGATSDIAIAFARRCAEGHQRLVLVGRGRAALDRLAADLSVRGAPQVVVQEADFARTAALAAVAESAWTGLGGLDVALIAYGSLPDQARVSADAAEGEAALALNFVSPALLSDALAARFEAQRAGTIAVITSVAGDRGRQSNYLYGAAKGGLQKFLEGLRHRLFKANVAVLDVRPGFVATKMTAHLPQGGPLWATPEKVAGDIDAAISKRGAVLYTPWFWFGIMAIVRNVPRPLFHRSKL
ncbi:SDR family oxidoreductase [Xanthobacter sp. VNH20]|uniref:SDR family oxidoreductase n=1 Tax=Xanthobacter sp. VNH20 TaxID=3156616 RepID=UPI0032B41A26